MRSALLNCFPVGYFCIDKNNYTLCFIVTWHWGHKKLEQETVSKLEYLPNCFILITERTWKAK